MNTAKIIQQSEFFFFPQKGYTGTQIQLTNTYAKMVTFFYSEVGTDCVSFHWWKLDFKVCHD